tara:strand:+ start:366 stop:968 length:603 start_codon:yes stop_codon:yes gene_type:complete
MDVARLIASLVGFVPLFLGAHIGAWSICPPLAASVVIGVLASGNGGRRDILVAAEAIAAVMLTLALGLILRIQDTLLGALRILWLVVTVTSSCSYVVFRQVGKVDFLPNDVTVVTLVVSMSGLMLSVCCARVISRGNDQSNAPLSKLAVEALLMCGALCLRFEEDVSGVVGMPIGWTSWHVASNAAAAVTAYAHLRRNAG